MHTIEAMLSLMVFSSILLLALPAMEAPRGLDDSLYRMQLAQDVWRVLYLRGNLGDFGEDKREAIERDMDEIGERTSFCIFVNGTRFTNCRGGPESHRISVSLTRSLISEGNIVAVRFSLGK